MAIAGLVVVMYPAIASWFSARAQSSTVAAYANEIASTPSEVLTDTLAQAQEYNAAIPEILLTDPYTLDDAMSGRGGAYETYEEQLRLASDTRESPPMARIRIPTIDVNLPVYHGTEDMVLERGAGHLFGSSLPVGGEGTHSVITAHAGLVEATMFDHLVDVAEGDEILIDVMGEQLTYRVTGSETVLPTEVSSLRLEPGEDLLTLVTCTPIGVNSHRLLVHAERVAVPQESAEPSTTQLSDGTGGPGFPWWAVQLAGGVALILAVVTLAERAGGRRRPTS